MKQTFTTPFVSDPTEAEILQIKMIGRLDYTLMNDFLSKYSLQRDPYALRGFLASLLNIDVEEITNIVILNPIEPSETINDKTCILDIKLELNHSKIINIELQSRYQEFWAERTLTYLSRIYNQLNTGEAYHTIKHCIHIGIHSKDVFKKGDPRYIDQFYSTYKMLNVLTHEEYSRKFEIRVLLLNHLENATEEDKIGPNSLYKWARIFRATTWEELKSIAKGNPYMESFITTVKKLSADEKIAQACEARLRYSNELASYEASIAQKEETIANMDAEIADRDATIADKDATIANKNNEIADRDATIANKNNEIADKDATIANKNNEIADKDAEIERLKKELEKLKK